MIPLTVDVPMDRRPWMNYGLMLVILAAGIVGFIDSRVFCTLTGCDVSPLEQIKAAYHNQLLIPTLRENHLPFPILAVSSTFFHFGPLQLLGNLIFLWVFGNAVNYKFGQWGYLGLFVATAFVAGMFHYWITGYPVLGAANAVNGLMGAFLVFFPQNTVTMILYGRRVAISCGWVIAFYVVCDVVSLTFFPLGRMMLWGHVFGFLTGLGIALGCLLLGWVCPSPDEESILSVLGIRSDG